MPNSTSIEPPAGEWSCVVLSARDKCKKKFDKIHWFLIPGTQVVPLSMWHGIKNALAKMAGKSSGEEKERY
eukprot:scaffold5595_cov71-Skeletonema_dohrnii-CCMP3373.AAC.2